MRDSQQAESVSGNPVIFIPGTADLIAGLLIFFSARVVSNITVISAEYSGYRW